MENDAFCIGVAVGIKLYEKKVVNASKEKTHLKIDEELYYVKNGRERLRKLYMIGIMEYLIYKQYYYI